MHSIRGCLVFGGVGGQLELETGKLEFTGTRQGAGGPGPGGGGLPGRLPVLLPVPSAKWRCRRLQPATGSASGTGRLTDRLQRHWPTASGPGPTGTAPLRHSARVSHSATVSAPASGNSRFVHWHAVARLPSHGAHGGPQTQGCQDNEKKNCTTSICVAGDSLYMRPPGVPPGAPALASALLAVPPVAASSALSILCIQV